jgi:hypothetical protein
MIGQAGEEDIHGSRQRGVARWLVSVLVDFRLKLPGARA